MISKTHANREQARVHVRKTLIVVLLHKIIDNRDKRVEL